MDRVVSTKIWKDDADRLKEIAEENGVTVSELLRMLVYDFLESETELGVELEKIKLNAERKCKELKEVRGLLGRLSNYTNQIARALNHIAKQGTITREEEMEEMRRVAGEVLATCMLIENWTNERD